MAEVLRNLHCVGEDSFWGYRIKYNLYPLYHSDSDAFSFSLYTTHKLIPIKIHIPDKNDNCNY